MSHSNYMKTSGIIFLVLALLALWVIVQGFSIRFGSSIIPGWGNWAIVIVGGYLAYVALKKR